MRTNRLIATIAVALVIVESLIAGHTQTRPIVVHQIYRAGGPTPPSTVESLWSMSDLIVEGTVRSMSPADMVQPGITPPPPLIRTLYHFEITEAFHTPHLTSAGHFVDVLLPGGDRDAGDHIDRFVDAAMPLPQVNEVYILFLRHSTADSFTMIPTAGPDSIFLVSGDTLTPRGRSDLSKALGRSNRATFVATLRQLKGRG